MAYALDLFIRFGDNIDTVYSIKINIVIFYRQCLFTGDDTMNTSIAVVEDSLEEFQTLRTHFARFGEDHHVQFSLSYFPSGEEFLNSYRPVYDIVLMDIGLPKINGMDAAARLREMDQTVILIFVTSLAQYALQGYQVDALDFVVKPVTYANFALKLQRALYRLSTTQGPELIINLPGQIHRIPTSQLKYVEINNHQIVYHTISETISAYGSLKEIEGSLNPRSFVRCNNCYLVNLKYVRAVRGMTADVDGEELRIIRPKRKAFIQALNDYLGGGI